MPELPEVEVIARSLADKIIGQRIRDVEVKRRDLRVRIADDFEQLVTGREICSVYRVAKYLVMQLDSGAKLVFHMGMSGRILYMHAPVPEKHDCVVFAMQHGYSLVFNDTRRFGLVTLLDGEGYRSLLEKMGPDPFSEAFNADCLLNMHGKARIKSVLMNSAVIVGIGNIYASEILFTAAILPHREVSTLSREECCRIVESTREVLKLAIATGGSSIRDYRTPTGDVGNFSKHFRVYGRKGEKCYTCGGEIQVEKQGGRSTFFCRHCQK
ncbi:bifunctional DNA-formamidopyrimidine glycosylase/DNA-(apurinic or apyrimidinic site) lyase [Anaplasma phagocytophilum]|uniref:Formamidopyrimidine-DNA glycosylase n=2 Tax=Anaplasma phagocytophilum TaxID=948 RepID=A0A0F3Q2G4_ANAPH|nr:bifunctional DNA-formamidopyrimidine glycosylase/DNA-(apurinic or apyrimidinic site) lyase [Anaplasma phagocytophilum]EOA61978.1 formamidopyrimidine-DNA glycosylase [Anaplasma phagocytophilum str. CRT38]KDB56951.1 formamidopyrimidine-DNA glycosylase [Anaplasma phagocytophilum str. CRT35]KJV86673.1 formamidopyrimidine-DNA glycosylase [Anaplasma phagocytophilum str. CRT53-1]